VSSAARLAAFAVVLAVALLGGAALGAAAGPDPGREPAHPAHELHDDDPDGRERPDG
jgi:hypothetical protein